MRKLPALITASVCLACAAGPPIAAASTAVRVQATQELAVLLSAHDAHQTPDATSRQVTSVAARRPITGERTTLPVIARSTDTGGAQWLKVMLPGRPNGSTAWISERGTRELVTPWRLSIDLATRRVTTYRDGQVARRFSAVVGKPTTPTPTGEFFVEETLRKPPGEAGGPFALALSARSNTLHEFEGGPGQIAVHGRENLGGTLGTAASHGCVRLATAGIRWLAARIGPGTPVDIKAR